jgi:hypothetical protein
MKASDIPNIDGTDANLEVEKIIQFWRSLISPSNFGCLINLLFITVYRSVSISSVAAYLKNSKQEYQQKQWRKPNFPTT